MIAKYIILIESEIDGRTIDAHHSSEKLQDAAGSETNVEVLLRANVYKITNGTLFLKVQSVSL